MEENKTKNPFVTVLETNEETVKALVVFGGVLIKSVTKYEGGQSESMYLVQNGVLVNHGTEEQPDWRLNR